MKYLEHMAKMRLFKLDDIVLLTGNINTAKSILSSYEKKNYISRIRRDYYVFLDFATKDSVASTFEIASHIKKDGYLSYHSAFQYYACYNQVFNELTISSPKKFNSFTYDFIEYKSDVSFVPLQIDTVADGKIKVTSIERTIVDSIKDINKAGGLEELLECISLVKNVSEEKILEMLKYYNEAFLYQKVGYILSKYNEQLKLSDKFFNICKSKIKNKIQYIDKDEDNIYVSEWKLYVPEIIGSQKKKIVV